MLGPVLFLSFINDMNRSSNQMRFVHFADDATVFPSDSDVSNVHATENSELVGVDNFLKTNKLFPNVGKISYMIISNPKNVLDIIIREQSLRNFQRSNFSALHSMKI